ncbi:MAG TPA: type II toxin-antitoxin system HicB family antitoxin [Candidatus Methylomirabilis sp.]|nr:type II toxin-antitoxin system HicB family antitoxin [Candidatus Methylomirabilis sp.]
MRHLVVVEEGPPSLGAHAPDLPGCAVVGETREVVMTLIREAIGLHLEGLREDRRPIPEPSSSSEVVEIQAV